MRQRTTAINIRVTETEKRKMENAAKKCGLSLSAYLRKLGLGKQVQASLPQEFYEAYRGLTALRDNFKSLPDDRISDGFDYVINRILPNREGAVIEVCEGGWNWRSVGVAEMRVDGNQMMLRIPRDLIGVKEELLNLQFKWADHYVADDIWSFYE